MKLMKQVKQDQNGVTLILSVVLLAVVTFISFSISSIVIREIVGGRLALRSEPAISAANSGGEVGLYRLFRESGGTSSSGTLGQSNVTYQVTSDLYDDSYFFTAPIGGESRVLLYDAENTNNLAANYGFVKIILDSGSGIANYSIVDWTNVQTVLYSGILGAGNESAWLSLNSADDRYILIIAPNSATAVSGSVTARDNSNQPKGIPSDSPKLDVRGTNGPVQRRIEINL